MKNWKLLKKELLKNKETIREYLKLSPHYEVVSQLIEARIKKGLTQEQLAKKLGTKQSDISRIESANGNPTLSFLLKIAKITDCKIIIQP